MGFVTRFDGEIEEPQPRTAKLAGRAFETEASHVLHDALPRLRTEDAMEVMQREVGRIGQRPGIHTLVETIPEELLGEEHPPPIVVLGCPATGHSSPV